VIQNNAQWWGTEHRFLGITQWWGIAQWWGILSNGGTFGSV